MAGGSSLIDFKTLGKPLPFDGSTEKWASWAFKFEAWCGLLPDQGTSVPLELMDSAVAGASHILGCAEPLLFLGPDDRAED